jgi:uncharacterized protein
MPGSWLKQYEFAKLADSHTELEYEIPVGELPGVGSEVRPAESPLKAQFSFGRVQGVVVAAVDVRGEVMLVCQRCLLPLRYPLTVASKVALLASESEADRAPESLETFLAVDGRVSAAALAAEEVLLALPIAPRHEDEAMCHAAEGPAVHEDVQRPFADLRELLKPARRK